MSKITELARGQINASDLLIVDLVTPPDAPQVILIRWPGAPTVTNQRKFHVVAVAAIAVLDDAMVRLAAMIEAGEL